MFSSPEFKKTFKGGLAFLCIATIFVSGRIFYQELLNAPFLQIKEINISGIKRVSKDEVLELMDVELGNNIIAVDMDDVKRRIKKHPWVESANAFRKMPDKLFVEINERVPAAIINLDGLYLIDGKGTIFKRLSIEDEVDLPVITAGITKDELEDDERTSSLIMDAIDLIHRMDGKEPFGLDMLSEIKVDPTYGLTLHTMDTGARIEIGVDNIQEKLLRFDRVYQELGSSFSGVEAVDLNYGKKVVVRLKGDIKIKQGGGDKWGKRTI